MIHSIMVCNILKITAIAVLLLNLYLLNPSRKNKLAFFIWV